MTVSNEDRDPLVHTLPIEDYMAKAVGLVWTPGYYPQLAKAAENWLIAHGWGPRPKLPSGKINDWLEVAVYAIDNADSEIRADLAAVGIEVTD